MGIRPGRCAKQSIEFAAWAVLGSIATTVLILLGPTAMLWLGINQERLELDRSATPDIIFQVAKIVVVSLVLMVPIGFISGLFPVLVEAYNRDPKSVGPSTGMVYFTQTMGNFLGAALTGLLLLPEFGTINTLRLLGIVLTIMPVVLWTIEEPPRRRGRSCDCFSGGFRRMHRRTLSYSVLLEYPRFLRCIQVRPDAIDHASDHPGGRDRSHARISDPVWILGSTLDVRGQLRLSFMRRPGRSGRSSLLRH